MVGPGRRRPPMTIRTSTPTPTPDSEPTPTPESELVTTPTTNHSSTATSNSLRNECGISRGLRYNTFRDKGGPKAHITFPEGKYRPIGGWAKAFGTIVGVICREHAPFACGTWSHMESADKAMIYHQIQEKFEIDLDNPRIRKGLDKWLAARFRSHKNRMHTYFKSFGDNVERARQKPYRNVRVEEWYAVCEIFETPAFKNRSTTNKANRAKNLTNHCAGSKPFVTLRYEMRNMDTQEEPDMMTFYQRTHCREDGTWVTPHCQQLYDNMIQEVNTQSNYDEVYFQIVASSSSYVRGLGHGEVPPVSLRGNHADVIEARRSADEANRRADEANRRADEANQRAEATEQRLGDQINSLQAQLTSLTSLVQQVLGGSSSGEAHRPT